MLDRGHIDRDRHREHRSHRRTSLLRHFLTFPIAPGLLPSRVPARSTTGALIPGAGTPVRGAAGHRGTLTSTINIAPIAATANAHRHAAAPAAIQPVALLPLLHRTPPQHWTAPGCAGLNDVRKIAPTGIAPLEARGFLIGFPGLLCLGVGLKLSAQYRSASRARESPTRTDAEASAADRGRMRLVYVLNDVRKPKKIQNPPPGHRRSNRAYPRNHALFDPRPLLATIRALYAEAGHERRSVRRRLGIAWHKQIQQNRNRHAAVPRIHHSSKLEWLEVIEISLISGAFERLH